MTYSTPSAQGTPDFYDSTPHPGVLIDTETIGPTAGSANGAPFYVGNVPSMTIYAAMTCTEGWSLRVNWSLTDATGAPVTPVENYTGYGDCVVVNTIPVLAPWVFFTVVSADGPNATGVVEVFTAATTVRGSVTRYLNALCLDEVGGSVAGSSSADFYGSYLTPGLYQYYFQPQVAFNGQAYWQAASDGSIGGRLAGVQTLAQYATFAGQLVVGNMQPSLHIINSAAGVFTFDASLIGPV